MHAGVAGDQEQVPGKGHGGVVIARLTPAQDLPIEVFLAGVGPAHRLPVFTALYVVGQGAIDLAILGADHDPFRPVHARGVHGTGGQARIDQYLGLAGKAVAGIEPGLAVGQLQPLALALGLVGLAIAAVEPRHVQGAVVE
ncbi:hypothetical protein D3C84_383880 [compost metagenome]